MSALRETSECFPRELKLGDLVLPAGEPDHEHCPVGQHTPGVMGGWHCPCPCHHGAHNKRDVPRNEPLEPETLEWRSTRKGGRIPRYEAVGAAVFTIVGPLQGPFLHEGEFNLSVGGSVTLQFFPTLDAAKSLAQRLQSVLDSANALAPLPSESGGE